MNVFAHLFQNFQIIVLIFKCFMVIPVLSAKPKLGPRLDYKDHTSCDEFSQFARFNPYTLLNSSWLVFYYWGSIRPLQVYDFTMPEPKDYDIINEHLVKHAAKPINLTARHVFMWDNGYPQLLVEVGDRGQFELHTPMKDVPEGEKLHPVDVRFKQTGDNKVVGMMFCKRERVQAMSRFKDLPPQNKLQDAAARLKYRARGGKSYLYQGHNWMPVPERDERSFWAQKRPRRFMGDFLPYTGFTTKPLNRL